MEMSGRLLRHGYHELVDSQICLRLWSWKTEGWQVAASPAMVAGQLVHSALAAHFRGLPWQSALAAEAEGLARSAAAEAIAAARQDATMHLDRYVAKYARDYIAIATEERIVVDGVPATIDLVAGYQGKLALIDFKRVSYPNTLAYRVSGQLDLYGYIYDRKYGRPPDVVIYDLISDKGIIRVEYPPDLAKGCYQFLRLLELARTDIEYARNNPAYGWHCHTCPMVQPCHLFDEDGPVSSSDYLTNNFIREV